MSLWTFSTCRVDFFLLLLYAETASLSALYINGHNLKAHLSLSFFFFLQIRGIGPIRCCRASMFCLAQQQGLAESIFLRFLHPPPLLNYCSSPSMWCLDSTVSATAKWTQPLFDLSLHLRFGDVFQKAPEKGERVHFCDATSWNTVLLAQSSS